MAKQIQAKSQVKGKDINSYCLWQESIMMAILTSKWVLLEREHEKLALTFYPFSLIFITSFVCMFHIFKLGKNIQKGERDKLFYLR